MKAAVFRENSRDPERVLRIEDLEPPKARPHEVLIQVEAAAYNYNDLWAIWGDPVKVPLPHISGSDAAGTVVEVGELVKTMQPGDRVVSHANLSCRICDACTSGREFDCRDRIIWGFQSGPLDGGFGQLCKLPETNAVPIPDGVPFEDAAAISMVGLTAWHMLVSRARIAPGQTVLIMGGTSGIGMAGIQIAKLHRCTVLATAGSAAKMDACRQLGADEVVNHREPDWWKRVRELTRRQGVDVIFEHIGQATFAQELPLLKPGGTLVTTGATTGYDTAIDLRYVFFKGANVLGSTQGTRAELNQVLHWVGQGNLRPLIDTTLPFARMVEGHRRMMDGRIVGKLVTTPQRL